MSFQELKWFWDAGHGSCSRLNDISQLFQRGDFARDEPLAMAVDLLFQLLVLNALS